MGLLTPQQIDRVRDLIRLGPLTWQPDVDRGLLEKRLICFYWPDLIGQRKDEMSVFRGFVERDKKRAEMGFGPSRHSPLMMALPGATERFFNEYGGVRAKWWSRSGKSFAEYMGHV